MSIQSQGTPLIPVYFEKDLSEVLSARARSGNISKLLCECIFKRIQDFESELSADEEIGCRLVSFGNSVEFYINSVEYIGPELLVYNCQTSEGKKATLLQHFTQTNILLLPMPKNPEHEKPRRIGFTSDDIQDASPDSL